MSRTIKPQSTPRRDPTSSIQRLERVFAIDIETGPASVERFASGTFFS
jgi:hypothetical protein